MNLLPEAWKSQTAIQPSDPKPQIPFIKAPVQQVPGFFRDRQDGSTSTPHHHLRYPKYNLTETMPLIELHWGVLVNNPKPYPSASNFPGLATAKQDSECPNNNDPATKTMKSVVPRVGLGFEA